MKHNRSSFFKSISLILAFSLLPVQAALALSAPAGGDALVALQPQASGRLETRGNQPIQVNGEWPDD